MAHSELPAQVARFHQWRKACRESALETFGEREERAVAPQIRGARLDILARKTPARGLHVIRNFKQRKAFIAERARFIAPQLAAFTAFQLKMFGHIGFLLSWIF